MAIRISEETTVGDLMRNVPGYEEIFRKHVGRSIPRPVLYACSRMKISQTSARAGWTPEQVAALIRECNEAVAGAAGAKPEGSPVTE